MEPPLVSTETRASLLVSAPSPGRQKWAG